MSLWSVVKDSENAKLLAPLHAFIIKQQLSNGEQLSIISTSCLLDEQYSYFIRLISLFSLEFKFSCIMNKIWCLIPLLWQVLGGEKNVENRVCKLSSGIWSFGY